MCLEDAAKILDEFAAARRLSLARVPDERLAAMKEHLKRFVDQQALAAIRDSDQLAAAEYLAMLLRTLARQPPISFLSEEDPTVKVPMWTNQG